MSHPAARTNFRTTQVGFFGIVGRFVLPWARHASVPAGRRAAGPRLQPRPL